MIEIDPHTADAAERTGKARRRGSRQPGGAPLLFLPPYSPDYNPIEQVFAKLKALLRAAAARTRATLWHAGGADLSAFTPAECAHYIALRPLGPQCRITSYVSNLAPSLLNSFK